MDAEFWQAVESGDAARLAAGTGLAPDELTAVLPALSAWRDDRRRRSAAADWRYRIDWASFSPRRPDRIEGTWLLAGSPATIGRGAEIAAALTDAGADVVVAERTESIREAAGSHALAGVIGLVGLDETSDGSGTAGLTATVALVAALRELAVEAPLWLVTSEAVAAVPEDVVSNPAQALIWGAGIVLGLEEPRHWGGLIDLPAQIGPDTAAAVLALLAGNSGEEQVAVRGGEVFARRMVRALPGGGTPWRPRDTVLITGGTGALGGHLARWAAEQGAARVVLLSRRGPDAPDAGRLRDDLLGTGADVRIAACDIGDRDQLAALLAEVQGDGPPIRAVLHAAGVPGPEIRTERLTSADLAVALRPKTDGTANLEALLPGLDAFVLFSSGAGIWGNSGQAAYAAANAYVDAYAKAARTRGVPAVSVAWGAWQGGGMVDDDTATFLSRMGVSGMDPATAVAVLADAVGDRDGDLVVADIDWSRFAPAYHASRTRLLIADIPEARAALTGGPDTEAPVTLAAELEDVDDAGRRRRLVALVRREAADVLGHRSPDELTIGAAFRELGFDSLTAVALRNRLHAATGLRLPATLLFDHPNLEALAGYLQERLFGPDDAGTDPQEAILRAALQAMPLARFRQAGILDALLELAQAPAAAVPDEPGPTEAIADMDVNDLIQLALGESR